MQQLLKSSSSNMNKWKRFFKALIVLAPVLLLFLGCQVNPKLSETPDFNENVGKLYVHQITNKAVNKTKVFIDGEEIRDLALLDQTGVIQTVGEHEVEFFNLPVDSGISEIDYKIQKNRDLHLYYCQDDGSFHWYMRKSGDSLARVKSICQKATLK